MDADRIFKNGKISRQMIIKNGLGYLHRCRYASRGMRMVLHWNKMKAVE